MTQNPLEPCLLQHRILPKLWGGPRVTDLFGITVDSDTAELDPAGSRQDPIGECWEVFDRPQGSSLLRSGSLKGRRLRDLVRDHRRPLLGGATAADALGRFPLLAKFVTAREPLSVQVHPDDGAVSDDGGKTEAWVVLDVEPEAWVMRGLKPGVGPAAVAAACKTHDWDSVLQRFTPAVGDVIFMPAGTVHCLGPGMTVFEIQQNSDVTYRLDDLERLDRNGKPRELHIEQGLQAIDYSLPPETVRESEPFGHGGEWLVRCDKFRLRRLQFDRQLPLGTEDRVKVLTVIKGNGVLGWRSGNVSDPLPLQPGDTAVVPASANAVFLSPVGTMVVLVSDPGDPS
jgi:mannose-6-phosphate isomerase